METHAPSNVAKVTHIFYLQYLWLRHLSSQVHCFVGLWENSEAACTTGYLKQIRRKFYPHPYHQAIPRTLTDWHAPCFSSLGTPSSPLLLHPKETPRIDYSHPPYKNTDTPAKPWTALEDPTHLSDPPNEIILHGFNRNSYTESIKHKKVMRLFMINFYNNLQLSHRRKGDTNTGKSMTWNVNYEEKRFFGKISCTNKCRWFIWISKESDRVFFFFSFLKIIILGKHFKRNIEIIKKKKKIHKAKEFWETFK